MNENGVTREHGKSFFSQGGPARRVSFPRTRNRVAHTGAREARDPIDAASAPSHARIRRHGGPPRGAKLPGRDHVEPVRVCPSRCTAGLVPLREYDRARRARDLTLSSSPRLHRPPPHQRAAQPSHGQGVLRTRRRRDAPRGGALSSRLGLGGSAGRASTRVARDALGGALDALQDPPPQDAPAFAGDRRRAPGVPGRLRAQALRASSFRARAVPRDVSSRGGPAGRGGLFQFPAEQRRRRRRRARGPRRAVEAGEARGHVPCPVLDRNPSVPALQAER